MPAFAGIFAYGGSFRLWKRLPTMIMPGFRINKSLHLVDSPIAKQVEHYYNISDNEEDKAMIKRFLQCTSIRERIDLLSSTVLSDWNDQDLDVILKAFNISPESFADKVDKIGAIEKYLADYKHEVENKATMNCKEIDEAVSRDAGETLYEEKGIGSFVKKMLNS